MKRMPRTDKSNASRNGQFRYIDFHTHILPNIDDGSKSLDESLKMLDMSLKSQVYCSVLTPHFYPTHDSISAFLYKRNQAFDKLKSSMTQNYPLLRVGAEVQYFNGISQTDELEKLKIVGTELILIEMPFMRWTDEMLTEIFAVNERPGFHVVLAHIERYLSFMPDGALDLLRSRGLIIQSNASFFTNFFTRRRALELLKSGYIMLIGSDCHNITTRPPGLQDCYKRIRSALGDEETLRFIQAGLKLLLHGSTSPDPSIRVREAIL